MTFLNYIVIKIFQIYYKYFPTQETEDDFGFIEEIEPSEEILFDYNRLAGEHSNYKP